MPVWIDFPLDFSGGVLSLYDYRIKENGFSIRKYKPDNSSPRGVAKATASNVGLTGSRFGGAESGSRRVPSSSFLESGRQGAFRNHVNSLLLQRRTVARALLPPASQAEVGTRQVVGMVEKISEAEVVSKRMGKVPMIQGVVAEMRGTEGLGKKENVLNCGVGEKNLLEGKGDNLAEFRAIRKDSSGPNSLEQLYANIPGIGLPMEGTSKQGRGKFKRVARDASRYSADARMPHTDQNDGRKRSRDGFLAAAARQVGDDYISLGVDQAEAGGKDSNGFIETRDL
ncbi:hypothetical protein COLO4_33911 [Corchorus olitorius]|uniref:Uncharacterized protein n=1 Tax=Corchorus olitorius TaxID=93759 RepID=A0A1R3GQ02_9ROSI|nr:hypothetical protein COLO4_33911 [Corchorus olitorius]